MRATDAGIRGAYDDEREPHATGHPSGRRTHVHRGSRNGQKRLITRATLSETASAISCRPGQD